MRQNCGQATPGGHVGHTVTQPRWAAANDMRLPGTSPVPPPLDPQPITCEARKMPPTNSQVRPFMILPMGIFVTTLGQLWMQQQFAVLRLISDSATRTAAAHHGSAFVEREDAARTSGWAWSVALKAAA